MRLFTFINNLILNIVFKKSLNSSVLNSLVLNGSVLGHVNLKLDRLRPDCKTVPKKPYSLD